MHALDILFLIFFSANPNNFKQCQNALSTVFSKLSLQFQLFKIVSEIMLQNACFRDHVFISFLEVTTNCKQCKNTRSSSFSTLSHNIISNSVRMYHFTVQNFQIRLHYAPIIRKKLDPPLHFHSKSLQLYQLTNCLKLKTF